jgi:BioD-like phosphotransacetylase family protein
MRDGHRIGYLKPFSLQPGYIGGTVVDEDATFVKKILNLKAEVWELSPVVVTPNFLKVHLQRPDLREKTATDLLEKVKEACDLVSADCDIVLLEGGGSLREGYVVGLPTPEVAKTIAGDVLAIVKYRDEIRLIDDAIAARTRLGDMLCGLIINRVPQDATAFVSETALPYLEKRGIPIFGVLPEVRALAALTVSEIVGVLEAEVLTKTYQQDALVETLTVGAMTTDAALRRFRKQSNKAVITGGDRTDIQLAALETSTTCLVLTGNLRPSPLIVQQADELEVSVLLVRSNTMETVEAIEQIYGKSRLGQEIKFKQFEALLATHLDWRRLYQTCQVSK